MRSERLQQVSSLVDQEAEENIELLRDFVRRPSRTGYLDEVSEFAEYLVGELARRGWDAEAVPFEDHGPVVLAERQAPPGRPTVVLYSHYDVISPEPVEEWTHPPFDAVRVDGKIVGRGTTDAKANLLALILAVDTFASVHGEPPCGVKLIIDGDEERGSPTMAAFVEQNRERLTADAAMSFDGGIDATGVPKIGLGTSGMVYVELRAQGAKNELHSAGARLYVNPAWRLTWALSCIKSPDETVPIPGFYDDVAPPSETDRELLSAMAWDDAEQLDEVGLDAYVVDVEGIDAVEHLLFQPGLAICGLTSGFQGEGPKAVIPNEATAKLEFRIVPDQTPERVLAQLRAHLQDQGFGDIDVEPLALVETAKTEPRSEIVRAATDAARELYGEPLVKPTEEYAGRQGAWLGRMLDVPGVQTGIGPPGHRGHATDEFVTEHHYILGIKYAAGILGRLGGET